jgi:hypothetical protein
VTARCASSRSPAGVADRDVLVAKLGELHQPFGIYSECDCKWDDELWHDIMAGPTADLDKALAEAKEHPNG